MRAIPTLLCDFYKVSHHEQYPEGTEKVYSTWTARSNKYHSSIDKVVAFKFQAFIQEYLIDFFNDNFFNRPKNEVVAEYSRYIKYCLGVENPDTLHIELLHDVGFLPIVIYTVPEGTLVPIRVPMLTIENTNSEFFWLTNFLETLMSAELWLGSTSATIAYEYRKLLDAWAEATGDPAFVPFQGHDFSMRGMGSLGAACSSGAGHLLSFVGTDTIPAIMYLEQYYDANIEKELVGTSIPATEHSVMCAGGFEDEFQTYERLITEIYPNGFVSIVSDTWDLWKCISDIITPLKDKIMARDGRVVIRPDSGDPVKIITGYTPDEVDAYFSCVDGIYYTEKGRVVSQLEIKGLIESLWEIFGGVINEKGYKVLDSHIGAIYGDSITLERCRQICLRLAKKGFASTNMVYGIGSYTYQYNTRDTFGFALKSTYCIIDKKEKAIFKNPVTDDGTKKSNTGMVKVVKDVDGRLTCIDGLKMSDDWFSNEMRAIFVNGILIEKDSLATIRERLASQEQK